MSDTSLPWHNSVSPEKLAIMRIDERGVADVLESLSCILVDCVNAGASVSFMSPLSYDEANNFWSGPVLDGVRSGGRILFGANIAGKLLGTVQLITNMPPNQPHRAEIAKLLVHPNARRLGIARALMLHAIEQAVKLNKTLITLDTTTGSHAETLYQSVGFNVAGIIPDYASSADGKHKQATTYMYHLLR